jgi:hypothetical protein
MKGSRKVKMCLAVFPSKIQASHNNNDEDIVE